MTSYGNSSRLQVPFVVIVPFRGNGNQHRAKAFDALLAHLVEHDAVVKVSNPAGAWSPGRARNHGVRHLDYMETSVVVFNDADTICPWNQTLEAVEMAATKPGLVYAYDLYLRRGEDGRLEQELYSPPSMGCAAISVDAFHQVGGFDERFEGWGYEDCDFALRCNRLWDNRRVSGPVEHLWHGDRRHDDSPLDSEPVLTERNWDRWNAQTA